MSGLKTINKIRTALDKRYSKCLNMCLVYHLAC